MLFGDRSTFAIEAEVDLAQSSVHGLRGHLRLWLGGHDVGDFGDDQLLDDAALVLQGTPPVRPEVGAEFAVRTSLEILDALYQSNLGISESKRRFLFSPELGSAFDSVFATRIRYPGHDEVYWRAFGETAAHGVKLSNEEFDAAVTRFAGWVAEVRARLAGDSSEA